jgi:hypothetical protein
MAASYAIGSSPQPPYIGLSCSSSFLNGFITESIIEAPPQPPFIIRRREQFLTLLLLQVLTLRLLQVLACFRFLQVLTLRLLYLI